jgi:hypothetical protein
MRHTTERFAAAAIVAVLASAQPAFAIDDMGSNPAKELFDALGMGTKEEKPQIDYRERAPLVPPPSTAALPKPLPKNALAQSSGQWPIDPDEERREAKIAEERIPITQTRWSRMERDPKLRPGELGGRRTEGAGLNDPYSRGGLDVTPVLTPRQLREQGTKAADASVAAQVAEPPRRRLTDPPMGYRAPAPGAPYGSEGKGEAPTPWYKKIIPLNN